MPRSAAPTTRTPSSRSGSRSGRTGSGRAAKAPRPSVPLGSLTQRSADEEIHCQACGTPRVTHIAMQMTDGSSVALTSCHVCEHRTWLSLDGGELPVADVLDRARKVS